MNRAETISKIKEQFNSLYERDKSFLQIDDKKNIVKFGGELYICNVENDPDSCELTSKIEDACSDTIQKALDRVSSEVESVGNYMKDKKEVDLTPDDKIPILTPEQKAQQEIDNELVPDNGQPEDEDLTPD